MSPFFTNLRESTNDFFLKSWSAMNFFSTSILNSFLDLMRKHDDGNKDYDGRI